MAAPGPGAAAALAEAAEICQGLEEVASFKGELTPRCMLRVRHVGGGKAGGGGGRARQGRAMEGG